MRSVVYQMSLISMIIAATLTLMAPVALSTESDEELEKKTQNPVASLISVPFQSNWDFNLSPKEDKSNYLLNVQPVIPISLGEQYNLILRTIVPIKANEYPTSVGGMGDILQSFFIGPKDLINEIIAGSCLMQERLSTEQCLKVKSTVGI